ncbi:MAG: DegT/DnrJ/EryC1/StrS aminotransferase family protein [Planctomycetota bacterium]
MTPSRKPVPPFYLDITPEEREEIKQAVDEALISGQLVLGPQTQAFEEAFAGYIGVEHAVSTNSGTSALEIIFRARNIEGRRVAVPTNTNFATVAAIIHAGGTPVMLDMDPDTFMPTLDMLKQAREKQELAGAVWVHIGGLIAPDFEQVVEFCHEQGMFMVEDAAHAHGSSLHSAKAGALGTAGAFSFFPTKVMTTLEGGMITTNDKQIADLARSFRNQGKRGAVFGNDHADMGNSWRLNEVSAAIGRVQLRKLDKMAGTREAAARALLPTLESLGLEWCSFEHMKSFAGYKLIIRVPEDRHETVADLKQALRDEGCIPGGGVYDKPCHLQPVFQPWRTTDQAFPHAERWCPNHICPPITSGVTEEDVRTIKLAFERVFSRTEQPGQVGA